MSEALEKPVMIFDGDCSFCRRWVTRWSFITGDTIEYQPAQKVADQFPQIPREQFDHSVVLIEPDGATRTAAAAVFRAFALANRRCYLSWAYQSVPGFAAISEGAYRIVAAHRDFFDKLDVKLFGREAVPQRYFLTRSIFVRLLALIYLAALRSFYVQMDGLIGSNGILPAADYLTSAKQAIQIQQLGARWTLVPTLAWVNSSDAFLHGLCVAGICASILVFIGLFPAPLLFCLWLIYLSFVSISQVFLGYQWDYLLLEVGFLAIFFAPIVHLRSRRPPSRMILLLLRWLLFRLMFMSALVKLTSHDPTWANLTAMKFHYETQPLPTPLAWYADHAPELFQKFSTLMVFILEGLVPLLYFTPRRPRRIAFWITVFFQCLILLTGNYGFFNLLAIVLATTLIDDFSWPRWLRKFRPIEPVRKRPWIRRWALAPIFVVIAIVSIAQFISACEIPLPNSRALIALVEITSPFGSINPYGLFAVMTTSRHEIILEGSDDGVTWKTYEFKYKPGDPARRPVYCQPHMPRLDWQMWFAALSRYEDETWFRRFEICLLENKPAVLALLKTNPFPDHPPKYIRASVYDYHFTDAQARRKTGDWWTRKPLGLYAPTVSLRAPDAAAEPAP